MSNERRRRGTPVIAILGIVLLVVVGVLGLIGLSLGPAPAPAILSAARAG